MQGNVLLERQSRGKMNRRTGLDMGWGRAQVRSDPELLIHLLDTWDVMYEVERVQSKAGAWTQRLLRHVYLHAYADKWKGLGGY